MYSKFPILLKDLYDIHTMLKVVQYIVSSELDNDYQELGLQFTIQFCVGAIVLSESVR